MKKSFLSVVLLIVMLFSFGISANADEYDYSYYLSSAEYVDDGKIEATVVLSSKYGSTVDVNSTLVLAIYDDTTETLLSLKISRINYFAPSFFL